MQAEGWVERGRCVTDPAADPADFFPLDRRSTAARRAKALCAQCPVTQQCLEMALRIPDTYGIWGGLDEVERDHLTKRMTVAT